jgi:serine/threonine protein phosphatase PrpC
VSQNLSRDHKPDLKDESLRIKKRGGRIEPYRDENNEFMGPARVWLRDEEIPGLAMSRSFGDEVAASVGITAQPEIIEWKLTAEDKFIILASDGVWEFLESEEVL